MDSKLEHLVIDFQESVKTAVVLMYRSGIQLPSGSAYWIEMDIPHNGELDGGIAYYKHGAGCRVNLPTGIVDFDFGKQGEIGGFNGWWLTRFAGERLTDYGFSDTEELNKCIENAFNDGKLDLVDYDLYYVANTPRTYALDLDCRFSGDKLPSRNNDPVLVLHCHYFESADLMLENYEKLSSKRRKTGSQSQRKKVEQRIYLTTWLGFLWVTCKGYRDLCVRHLLVKERPESFKELIPISDNIGWLIKKHADSLRMFRNNVFHLREDPKIIRQFFNKDVDRFEWAQELHTTFKDFFSQYHMLCNEHYIMNGRKGECDLFAKRRYRKKKVS